MIVIDDREVKLIERFIKREIEHKVKRLYIGDSHVSGRLPVEIKRIFYNDDGDVVNDVKASLKDGRYREQSQNRRDIFKRNAVIVQINVRNEDLFNEAFTYNQFFGFVISIQHRYKSMFFLSEDVDGTIDILLALYKREIEAKAPEPINRPPRPKTLYQRQRYFLNGLIGCGDQTTIDLLNYYKTPVNILSAIINDHILNVKGIGKIFLKNNKELLLKETIKEEKKHGTDKRKG